MSRKSHWILGFLLLMISTYHFAKGQVWQSLEQMDALKHSESFSLSRLNVTISIKRMIGTICPLS